jgi:hypothetical protein
MRAAGALLMAALLLAMARDETARRNSGRRQNPTVTGYSGQLLSASP